MARIVSSPVTTSLSMVRDRSVLSIVGQEEEAIDHREDEACFKAGNLSSWSKEGRPGLHPPSTLFGTAELNIELPLASPCEPICLVASRVLPTELSCARPIPVRPASSHSSQTPGPPPSALPSAQDSPQSLHLPEPVSQAKAVPHASHWPPRRSMLGAHS